MRYLVIGSGRMAFGAVYDLLSLGSTTEVYVSDWQKKALSKLTAGFKDKRLKPVMADAKNKQQMLHLMAKVNGVLSAASYDYNYNLSQWAVAQGCHFVDLGGNYQIVERQFKLDKKAKKADVGIIPDCGLAPGMVSVVAAHAIAGLEKVTSLEIRVGGLPLEPQTPLNYRLVFSVKGLINEYKEKAIILDKGKLKTVPSMTELESLSFPSPFDNLEAFYTSGGTSTLPYTYRDRIKNLNYKTIRYPGHCHLFKAMLDLGFAEEKQMKMGDKRFSRRELFEHLLEETLTYAGEDVTLIRVSAEGYQERRKIRRIYQAIEYGDKKNNLSAMMRTTAFPAIIALEMLVDGRIPGRGVLRQEVSIPADIYLKELKKRNIRFEIKTTT
jgi:lysine 6-dehydrogenase